MTLYDRIETACKAKNLTPTGRELEKMMQENNASFSRTTVNKWRDGTMPKSCAIVAELANVLQVSSDYLLCRTDDPADYATIGTGLTDAEKTMLQMFRKMDSASVEDCMRHMEYLLFKQENNTESDTNVG